MLSKEGQSTTDKSTYRFIGKRITIIAGKEENFFIL